MKKAMMMVLGMGAMLQPTTQECVPTKDFIDPMPGWTPKRHTKKAARVSYGPCHDKRIARRRKANKIARKMRRINRQRS